MSIDLESELTHALDAFGSASCPNYRDAARRAATLSAPPYVGDDYIFEYQRRASEPRWLCACLLANAVKEADGARDLCRFAGRIPAELAELMASVVRHANDEAKHARVFLRLLDLTFPEAELSETLRKQVDEHIPLTPMEPLVTSQSPYSTSQVLDELCQINIGEIRTRVNQLIIEPALAAHASPSVRDKVVSIARKLLADEQQHIAYTAEHIELLSQEAPDTLVAVFAHRFQRFNHRTLRELSGDSIEM